MNIPIEIVVEIVAAVVAAFAVLIGAVAYLFNSRQKSHEEALNKLTDTLLGPAAKVVTEGRCSQNMANVREQVSEEKRERKGDILAVNQRLDEHIGAAA